MPLPSDFYDRVYDLVRLCPPGRVTTYGAVAAFLGQRSAARTVGYALHAQKLDLLRQGPAADVPAHRVLNRTGVLSGRHHFGGNRMQELLEAEGIQVRDHSVVNFAVLFWDPAVELDV